jgi:hypothetical protein
MNPMMKHVTVAALSACVVTAVVSALAAQSPLAPTDADALQIKIDRILARAMAADGQPARTVVTDREVNSYLAFVLADTLPTGVVEPSITTLGGGRVTGRAVVDLDLVRQDRNPTGLLDPSNYLRGRVPLTATGVVRVHDGIGQFTFESAAAGALPLPKVLLQYVISYYSRTPERPDGISLDDAVPMPAGIQAIAVEQGRAIIVQ